MKKRENFKGPKKDENKKKLEKIKKKSEEEEHFDSIYKMVKERFAKKKLKAEAQYFFSRQLREEEQQKKLKEEKIKEKQEVLDKQQEKLRWKFLRSKEEMTLTNEERQFLKRMNTKFPNPYKNLSFMLYYYFNVEKTDGKEDSMQREKTEKEDIKLELNEKEQLFDTTVKRFRTKIEQKKDWEVLQECYRVLGSEYFKKHDIREALKYFQAFKTLCEKNKAYTMKMLAYKEIGFCYKLVKQYKSALINFKKLLQLAWYRRSREWEIKAYDYIGIAYYYLGEIDKSKYYHRRMWDGVYENENSAVRKLAIAALKQKLEGILQVDDRGVPQIKEDSSYVINQSDEDENDLPSPRTGSGEENVKLLPFSNMKKPETAKTLPYLKTQRKILDRKDSKIASMSSRIKPFMLISHLSPNESPNNYFYVEQMNTFRIRGEQFKGH